MDSRLRIIVTGMVGLFPVGGVAWDYLQYMVGFSKLRHDVYYYEDTWRWPYHPIENQYTPDGEYSAKYIKNFFELYAPELISKWHYLHMKEKSFGMKRDEFNEVAMAADLFINISGASFIPDNLSGCCIKVFIDTDPGYNQIMLSERFPWSANIERWCEIVDEHDEHFTYAENIHSEDCLIPKLDFKWKTTRMPIVMDFWKPLAHDLASENAPWTTVMTWNDFKGKLIYNGVEYKSKGSEFDKIIKLPLYISKPILIAVGGVNSPIKLLEYYGWNVKDGPKTTLTPKLYQDFIAGSRGEISIAKHVYVAMRSGWFSCRSACYLAAGHPVVVQDTGFSSVLPVGEGILPFSTIEEAVEAIHDVNGNHPKHSKAAREIAGEYFDSDKVLTRLIEEAMN